MESQTSPNKVSSFTTWASTTVGIFLPCVNLGLAIIFEIKIIKFNLENKWRRIYLHIGTTDRNRHSKQKKTKQRKLWAMGDQKAWLSYEIKNYTYLTIWLWTNRDEWAPKDRTDWSDLWQNIILTLWSYFGGASTFSQLGSRVYWRLEAAGPLRCACVEVFFPTDKHSVVVAETWIHHSFMTRAIAVWWSEREVCNKIVGVELA